MFNYLVQFRVTKYGIKTQQYHTVVARDIEEARDFALRLAALLPGTVTVVRVRSI